MQYIPLSYPFYQQDLQMAKGGEEAQKAGKQAPKQPGSQPVTKEVDKNLCLHCKHGYHQEDDCWIKHPEKHPPSQVLAAQWAARKDRLNEACGSANSVLKGSGWGMWIFDMAVSWHICSRKSAFDRYIDLNHYLDVELPDGSIEVYNRYMVWVLSTYLLGIIQLNSRMCAIFPRYRPN